MINVFEKSRDAASSGMISRRGWVGKLMQSVWQSLTLPSADKMRESRLMGLYFSDANRKPGYSRKTGFRERVQH